MLSKKKETKKTFSEWASHYDDDHWTWYFDGCIKKTLIILERKINSDSIILDVGCGTGRLLLSLADKIKDGRLEGIDISNEMLDKAKKNLSSKKNIHVSNVDIHNLKEVSKYDVIFCLNSLHHFENQREVFTIFNRGLKQKGLLVIVDPIRNNPVRFFWEFFSKHLIFREPYIHYMTKEKLSSLCNQSGFSLNEWHTIYYFTLISVWEKQKDV